MGIQRAHLGHCKVQERQEAFQYEHAFEHNTEKN